ncbi:MAG TPA: long-chain fatty acid--CoA ligase [Bacteroidales bacterium]|nr:long-chain fatty acid--CoA ligase [Bacteroidales bacterium]
MEITRTFDILDRLNANFKKDDVLSVKRNGNWEKFSTEEYYKTANYLSYGLLALGIKKGDKVASVSNNRPEWNFLDMGISQIGAVHVPVYPTISVEEYEHILEHSDARIIFMSDKALVKKIKPVIEKTPNIETIYTFNEVEGEKSWTEVVALGKENEEKYKEELISLKKNVLPTDLCSIIYTSGTTGLSKGVMLSHRNFISNVISGAPALPIDETMKVLSFLPLCHVYERLLTYVFQYKGISIYYAESMGTLINDMKEVKPDGFDTVPRLLERVFDGILAKGKNLKGFKKAIFNASIKVGLKYEFEGKNGWWYETKRTVLDKLVYTKWRDALGGNVKFIGSGGAALQPRLARVFHAAGINVQEGYGLTETSPLVAFNYYYSGKRKFGTVGTVIDNVEVKIAEDGEILVRGENVMLGYYKNPELTAEVIDEEGWFHTGDVGIFEDGKYLKITDRKKEIFKMSSGKYVAPQAIENKFKESELIEQVMVVGENQKFASALISPNFTLLQDFAKKHHIEFSDRQQLIDHPQILTQFQKEVNSFNKQLGQTEEIKRFKIVTDEWTPESGELSPTLKLKRRFLYKKYNHLLEQIYMPSKNNIIGD